MTLVEDLFEAVSEEMSAANDGVEIGKIFHSTGLKSRGKFFAFVRRGEFVVKLPAERVAQLVSTEEGVRFEAGKGRPMKEWVVLRPADRDTVATYVEEAFIFLTTTER
jgi:hypothetical protein